MVFRVQKFLAQVNCRCMSDSTVPEGTEVRSYFVRERNAMLVRADVGELFVDGGGRGVLEKLAESRAGIGVPPRRRFDLEAIEAPAEVVFGESLGQLHEFFA